MDKYTFKKEIGLENFIALVGFLAFFITIGSIMGGVNMMKTMMATGFDLLINTCFYLMAVAVLAGAFSSLFSEFGIVSLINSLLSPLMKPLYNMPGAASLGMLNCYLSDNPAILTLADDDNFRRYFKQYQLPALTNLGTAFGMGFIATTAMMALDVKNALPAALIGNVGAIAGSVVSVRLMIYFSKKVYGTEAMVKTKGEATIPAKMREVHSGKAGFRFIQAMLQGGKSGVAMGVAIIPGVVVICTFVMMLTKGASPDGTYTGAAYEGVAFLPWLGKNLNFILKPLYGFTSPEAISVPITALGSTGAALGMIKGMAAEGVVKANDIAVFTAICMCWSGYISTHIAMMDALDTKEMTGKAILSHTIGGLFAGFVAHLLAFML